MKRRATVVPAVEFKAKCLGLFDEVEARKRSFVITKRGRPVARVVPLGEEKRREEELMAPVRVDWSALS